MCVVWKLQMTPSKPSGFGLFSAKMAGLDDFCWTFTEVTHFHLQIAEAIYTAWTTLMESNELAVPKLVLNGC